jgi:hypothetical protein
MRQTPPFYTDIIEYIDSLKRLFDIVVQVDDGTIPDPVEFVAYLAKNPPLDAAIKSTNEKYWAWHQGEDEKEERRARKEAREKAQKEKDAADKAFFKVKANKDAALKRSVTAKLRESGAKRKFTKDEHDWYVRKNNKLPLKDC